MDLDQNQTQEKQPARKPDYKGKMDVAAWLNKDKNGKTYISVKLATNFNMFKNEPQIRK